MKIFSYFLKNIYKNRKIKKNRIFFILTLDFLKISVIFYDINKQKTLKHKRKGNVNEKE